MKKKITSLLLALGCVLGVGTVTACAQPAQEEPACQHPNAKYVLVDNFDEGGAFQPTIQCDDCIGFSMPEVEKSECQAVVTEPTSYTENDGYTVYKYQKDGNIYLSEKMEFTHKHPLGEFWIVAKGDTLCEDGGTLEMRCTNEGCTYVDSSEKKDGQGHISNNWTVKVKPTFMEEGEIEGTCNAWNKTVNGENFTGCGKTLTQKIPALNDVDYKIEYSKDYLGVCGESGTTTYVLNEKVDGQTISFEIDLKDQDHVIKCADGSYEYKEPYEEVLVDDEKYADCWFFFLGESSTCSKSGEAGYQCMACGNIAPLVIVTPHVKSEEPEIAPDLHCDNPEKVRYKCAECEQIIFETLEHKYTYEFILHDVTYSVNDKTGDFELLTGTYEVNGTCANCPKPIHVEGDVKDLMVIASKKPSCKEAGWVQYGFETDDGILQATATIPNATMRHKLNGEFMNLDKVYDLPNEQHPNIYVVDKGENPPCGQEIAMGVFYCDACEFPVEVQVTVGHTPGDDFVSTEATCDKKGTSTFTCIYCSAEIVKETPELGHIWKYRYKTRTQTHYVFTRKCTRNGCNYEEERKIIKEKCTVTTKEEGAWPNCQKDMEVHFSFKDDGKAYEVDKYFLQIDHNIDGIEIPYYDKDDNPIIYEIDSLTIDPHEGIQYLGCIEGKDPCEADSGAEGCFCCTSCGKYIQVKVEVAHTKPEGLGETVTEYDCFICGKHIDEEEE